MHDASALRLETERLILALPTSHDAKALLAYARQNREHLRPWSPPEPPGADSLEVRCSVPWRSSATSRPGAPWGSGFAGKMHRMGPFRAPSAPATWGTTWTWTTWVTA